jgi:hypothetical protein
MSYWDISHGSSTTTTMYVIDESGFSKLRFPVHKLKAGDDLIKKIPALKALGKLSAYDGKDSNKVIKYMMYMYDNQSPLLTLFPDIMQRKKEAAELAGIEDEKLLTELYSFKDAKFLAMVHEFLVHQNNRIWSMIVVSEQTFYEYQQKLLKPVTDADGDKNLLQATQIKSKLMEDCDTINQRLEGYYRKFYGEDDELVKKTDGFRRYTPEDIALLK